MNHRLALIGAVCGGLAVALASTETSSQDRSSQPATGPASAPAGGVIRLGHIRIDRANRSVSVSAQVCYNPGPLELLLCKQGSKEYESILRTPAQPSDLHAALLALGLDPGRGVRVTGTGGDHPPKMLPPDGPRLSISLRWKDDQGRPHNDPAGDWLTPKGKAAAIPDDWVFVGSQRLPDGRYGADQDGDIISLANFVDSVIDVPLVSTADNSALEFAANEKALPPTGTAVEVVITAREGAENAAAATAWIEIDRLGQYWVDGRAVAADKLAAWAGQYLQRHARGSAVIRAKVGALACDVEFASDQIRLAGMDEIRTQLLAPALELPPRTAEQAKAQLERWRQRLADADRMIDDPLDAGVQHLRQLQQEIQELERLKAVLTEYSSDLKRQIDAAKAATRPAR